MSQSYNPKEIEKKWQKVWEEEKAFQATNDFIRWAGMRLDSRRKIMP